MQGKNHLGLGLAAGISLGILTANQEPLPLICTTLSCSLGSIFPDIDTKTSRMGQMAKVTSFFLRLLFKHRGIIHTPFFLFVLNVPMLILLEINQLPLCLAYGFNNGYMLHLIQDSFTKEGVMWLYPFSMEKYKFPLTIRSGKHDMLEVFISAIIWAIVTGITYLYVTSILGYSDFRIHVDVLNEITKIKEFIGI